MEGEFSLVLALRMASLRILPVVVGCGAIAVASAALLLGGRRKAPVDRERARRMRISSTGRITDGTVLDAQEHPCSDGQEPRTMLVYSYNVSGVQYECSQDVTRLRQFVDLHSCRLGLPVSVKYDAQSPGNSIVISEEWSGLRK